METINGTKEETLKSLESFVETALIPVIADNCKTEVGSNVVHLSDKIKGHIANELLMYETKILNGVLTELFMSSKTALTWDAQKELLVGRIETLGGVNGSGNADVVGGVTETTKTTGQDATV